ncbi:MAG: EamA family transporter [Terriglobia bacterium]
MIWLVIAYIFNGLAQFFEKYLQVHGLGAYIPSALLLMYGVGIAASIGVFYASRGKISRAELMWGAAVGFCSFGGNFSVLKALKLLPAYTVFPIVIGGPIVVVAVCSALFLRERLSASAKWGIVCGVVAIALLTIQ